MHEPCPECGCDKREEYYVPKCKHWIPDLLREEIKRLRGLLVWAIQEGGVTYPFDEDLGS